MDTHLLFRVSFHFYFITASDIFSGIFDGGGNVEMRPRALFHDPPTMKITHRKSHHAQYAQYTTFFQKLDIGALENKQLL